ncbi:MAG: amidase family protein [Flavobacteriaceae bacterium]|nr:amidase family protein [Flavobacteriaceae bacterium]
MKKILFLIAILALSCKNEPEIDAYIWTPYDETTELAAQQSHQNPRMRYKLLYSKVTDRNAIWRPFDEALANFTEADYNQLKPLILEKDIPSLQASIAAGALSYETLTKFYIYRIRKFESDSALALNAVISLNPNVIAEAIEKDKLRKAGNHPIFGMPILIKDNIGMDGTATTAGAIALMGNQASDAFVVQRLKANGAIILGKANLSEWAYYLCRGCPVGYSAVGGQTMNPYGRKIFESGGSSSGSGVSAATNYAVAAVGTETSGSILSPSSQNSVVGLKPTIGLLSRSGIVPISSTLDTPGPMTKSVIDNAILLDAMLGKDEADAASVSADRFSLSNHQTENLTGKRFGVFENFYDSDTVYQKTVEKIQTAGGEIIFLNPTQTPLQNFLTLLNIDMKNDLPVYLESQASSNILVSSVADVVNFNLQDTLTRIPYGQQLFEGIVADTTSAESFEKIKTHLHQTGIAYFENLMKDNNLDAVLSINNYHAGYAAIAKYPCLTVPMGYKTSGEPVSLTFIGRPFEEQKLLQLGAGFEALTKARKSPLKYD